MKGYENSRSVYDNIAVEIIVILFVSREMGGKEDQLVQRFSFSQPRLIQLNHEAQWPSP